MSETIIMPTCKRPEMLALALQAIDCSENPPDDIRIFADTDSNIDDVEYVRDQFLPHALIFHAAPHQQVPSGMWNILNALKHGYQTADRVYLIEEDVVVYPDFFNWHRSMHTDDLLATCGRIGKRRAAPGMYTNPGSCLNRYSLGLIVPHINDRLFENHEQYLRNSFPGMEEQSTLDDGLIRRVQKKHDLKCLYPENPKCSHIGFMAYNHYMGWTNVGDICQRIINLRLMLSKIDPNGRYTGDFEPLIGPMPKLI